MKTFQELDPDQTKELVPDGAVVCLSGFIGIGNPDELAASIERSFLETGHPRDLTLVYAAGNGDRKGRGADRFAHEGLLKCVIGGHYAFAPGLQHLINEGKVLAYNLPQGTLTQVFRDSAGGRPGTITKVGLNTFVDPRLSGGKLNDRTTEDLVEVVHLSGEEWLLYKALPINVSLIRATSADLNGNLTVEKEAAVCGILAEAEAAHNHGGKVIAQVERIAKASSLDPRDVKVPGFLVDAVLVTGEDRASQTFSEHYSPAYTGQVKAPLDVLAPLPLTARKIIARRAFLELTGESSILNLGIGIPEGIASVAEEEGAAERLKLTVESGAIGGLPASGDNFGATLDPEALIDEAQQFDFYDGGGLDCAFIGLAQMDGSGNVNVSKFGPKIAGCGGAINITQQARSVVFCGTFTTGGLRENISNGKLEIVSEGSIQKLVDHVEQVTFSGDFAREKGQKVLFVTERAVFELREDAVVLTEIAPGIDVQRDVIDQMGFVPKIADDLKEMGTQIFNEGKMNILTLIA